MSEKQMEVKEYVDIALKTYISHDENIRDLTHFVSALAEEAGEACSILKRHCRGDFDFFESKGEQQRMLKELGDVLWYVNAIAHLLDSSLEEVMKMNNEKLLKRLKDDTIKGRGDDR